MGSHLQLFNTHLGDLVISCQYQKFKINEHYKLLNTALAAIRMVASEIIGV